MGSTGHLMRQALRLIPDCMEHILGQDDGKQRYCDFVLQMTKAYALCGTMDEAVALAKEAFHQAVRAPLIEPGQGRRSTQSMSCSSFYHRRLLARVWKIYSSLLS